jgi:hypothetical protein
LRRSKSLVLIIGLLLILGVGIAWLFVLPDGRSYLDRFGAQLVELINGKKKEVARLIAARMKMDEEVVDQYGLTRVSSSRGLGDLNSTDQYVEGTNPADAGLKLQPDQISNYQAYVTPNDPVVQSFARGKSYEAIYREAVSWVWVEDRVLNGVDEKWLSPNYFLSKSPSLPSNPVKGSAASDCEEQAYTLVSALRAAGMPAENVRVVTGKVDFGGSVGGHAWVEVFDQSTNGWFQLEATSGSYYDSSSRTYQKSGGLPYTFFKTYRYPAIQIWTYFNDKYFWDNSRQQGTVANNWLATDTIALQPPKSQVEYELPSEIRKFREERAKKLQEEIERLNQRELDNQIRELKRKIREQQDQQQSSQEPSPRTPESPRKIIEEQQGATIAIVGKVDEIDAGVITLMTRFGEFAVSLSQDTVISDPSGSGIEAIKQGAAIIVEGEQESESKIKARAIHIVE